MTMDHQSISICAMVEYGHPFTLPETKSSHLKMDGWNTIVSFWDGLFSGAMLVSGMARFFPQ